MSEVIPGVWSPMDFVSAFDPLQGGYAFMDRCDNGYSVHCGADLNSTLPGRAPGGDADLGAALRFPVAGEVVYLGWWNGSTTGYGHNLWLRLDSGDYLHYCHCDTMDAWVGMRGMAGQVVATCGRSGNQMWAHLHLECKREDPALAGYEYWPYGQPADYVRQHYVRPADWWAQLLAWAAEQGVVDVAILNGAQQAAVQAAVWGEHWNAAAADFAIPTSWREEWKAGRWRGKPLAAEQPVPASEANPAGSFQLFAAGCAAWLPGQPVSWDG